MTSEDYCVLFLATITDLVLEVLSIVLFLSLQLKICTAQGQTIVSVLLSA